MIRGPSGGGKTTLLNLVGTADMATSGHLSTLIKN
jgi:ABC-type lipoprotein export system ATPase subunit